MENGKPVLIGYIKSNEEINKETNRRIRNKISVAKELKLLRLKLVGDGTIENEFNKYNDFVEQCRAKGKLKKQKAAQKRKKIEKIAIQENGEDREIWVKK